LWPATVAEIAKLIAGKVATEHVFLNRNGQPITRFGIHTMVERNALKLRAKFPTLATKRVNTSSSESQPCANARASQAE
jgi:integrase/recombinase XerD